MHLKFENHYARVKGTQKMGDSYYLWVEETRDEEQEWKRDFTLVCLDFFPHACVSPILNKNLTIKSLPLWSKMDEKLTQCFWKVELQVLGYGIILKKKKNHHLF